MWKFSELPYERVDVDAFIADGLKRIDGFEHAKTAKEAIDAYYAMDEAMQKVATQFTISHIRHDVNTKDEFYDAEQTYYDQNLSKTMVLNVRQLNVMVNHPFRKELEEALGKIIFTEADAQVKLADERLIPGMTEEQMLKSRYAKLTAGCTTEYMGETCNFYGLLKFMQNPDRSVREGAFRKWAEMYAGIADELDDIYDKMVAVRTSQAKLIGYENYIPFAYLSRGRYDYTKDDVERFREGVKQYVVPAVARIHERQAKRIGVEKLHYYDESFCYPEGNPTPHGTEEEMVKAAQEMYRELSPETGEFFDFMVEHQLFDLTSRPGKHMGGYCTGLPELKAPFIFSNFNGTSADVDVLTHEAGHAFQAYVAAHSIRLSEVRQAPIEICEVHSMSMEHFTYPWMDKFFGDDAPRYREAHLSAALEVIPYLTMVDEFQHRVYAKPEMTRDERYAVWHELETVYLPWRDYDGDPFLEKGGFWMQKQHIFLYPFYYIDYALAQMGAFDFFLRMREDRGRAWNDYLNLCKAGGTVGYFDLLKIGNLRNPFAENTVKDIAEAIEKLL